MKKQGFPPLLKQFLQNLEHPTPKLSNWPFYDPDPITVTRHFRLRFPSTAHVSGSAFSFGSSRL